MDLSFVKNEKEREVDLKVLFISYLNGALSSTYKDGLKHDFMRRLFNISNKVEAADSDHVELEDAEFELIDEAFKNGRFNPAVSKVVVQIFDAIEEAKK